MKWILTLALMLSHTMGFAGAPATSDEIVRSTNIRRDLLYPSPQQKAKEESESALLTLQQTAPLTSPNDRILPSPGTHADYEARVGGEQRTGPTAAPHYQPHRSLQPLDKAPYESYPGQSYPGAQFRTQGIDPASR